MLAIYFFPSGWDEDGISPKRLQSRCQACQRIEARIRQGIRRRGRPFEARQPSLRRVNPEAYRQQRRAYHEAHKDEINARRRELYAQQKERRRHDYEVHETYIEALPDKHETYHARDAHQPATEDYADAIYKDKTVPVEPFREWLIKYAAHPDHTLAGLARSMGFADGSRLYQFKNATATWTISTTNGKRYDYPTGQKRVTLDLVDRCLIAAGADTALWELYDLPDAETTTSS
jgi:hypothetical protein